MTQKKKEKGKRKVAQKRGAARKKKKEEEKSPDVTEKKKEKEKSLNPDVTNVVPIRGRLPVEVLSEDETYANHMHIKIVGLMHQYEETYFNLAEALYEVRSKKLYRHLDEKYETFELYVESLGVEYRKARYLVRLWWWFGIEQNKNPKLLEGAVEIGWTKSAELVGVIDGRNAGRWFKLAKEMNTKDLGRAARAAKRKAEKEREEKEKAAAKEVSRAKEEEARTSYFGGDIDDNESENDSPDPDELPKGMKVLDPSPPKGPSLDEDATSDAYESPVSLEETAGIDPPENIEEEVEALREKAKEWKRIYFDIPVETDQIISDAIRYAKELGETENKGVSLGLICLHFVSFYDKQKSVVFGEWFALFERLTGFSLVAIDERTKEIAYGAELIDKLAATDEGEKENASESRVSP
jgi:hypothetical protein